MHTCNKSRGGHSVTVVIAAVHHKETAYLLRCSSSLPSSPFLASPFNPPVSPLSSSFYLYPRPSSSRRQLP
ncbi:hypothetical protein E2C01_094227 [Portunus trituberculatus]|uniref:Uncharacterized protein n=1 Tax=Portunus trituberculatus TaxID=210409 RepID=A0A5B7JWL7_PORTR|nr:hypothetical protein [Portunus trituberculatus]